MRIPPAGLNRSAAGGVYRAMPISLSPSRSPATGRSPSRVRTRPPRKIAIVVAIAVTLDIAGLAFWALLVAGAR